VVAGLIAAAGAGAVRADVVAVEARRIAETNPQLDDEPAAGLLLGEAVEGHFEGAPVLLDERIELGAFVVQRHVE